MGDKWQLRAWPSEGPPNVLGREWTSLLFTTGATHSKRNPGLTQRAEGSHTGDITNTQVPTGTCYDGVATPAWRVKAACEQQW